jgi:phosphate:Na+ symporter
MREIDKPGWAILAAALFTAVIQSSSATMGVIIALASQGLVSLETGIALMFGANIGTCATAILASIGRPREAVRVAVVHVLFKVVGVLLWIAFIAQLASAVRWISPAHADLEGAGRLAAETPRQIANAHTLFNVANALFFIGFVGPLAGLMRLVVPEKREEALEGAGPKYLDDLLLRTPDLALDRVRLELERLGACAQRMVLAAPTAVLRGTEADLARLREMDDDVDALHRAIIGYLGRLSRRDLSGEQSREVGRYLATATYMENIGDVIETNIFELGHDRLRHDFVISPQTRDVVRGFFDKTSWAVDRSIEAFVNGDPDAAREVIDAKPQVTRLANDAEDHLARRLTAGEPDRLVAFRIETDLIEAIKRIYYFAKRIAKLVAEEEAGAPSAAPARPPGAGS